MHSPLKELSIPEIDRKPIMVTLFNSIPRGGRNSPTFFMTDGDFASKNAFASSFSRAS